MIAKAYLKKRFRLIFEVLFITSFVFLNARLVRAEYKTEPRPNHLSDSVEVFDSLEAVVNKDILVLQRYGGEKRKWVKKGTVLKVFVLPFSHDVADPTSGNSFLSSKEVYRGKFESIIGDTLTITSAGNELKFDIDNLYQIKVFNEIGARIFGDMINLTSMVGFGYSGLLVGLGASWVGEEESFANALAGPLIVAGAGLGGLSYLLHRLGLIIRRNKYDLVNDWYIVRNF